MKLVDLVARIPKQLSLYFSDFSTILFRIYKFSCLNLGFSFQLLHLGPWNLLLPCIEALGRTGNRGGRQLGGAGRFPATRLAGGEG